MGRKLEQINDIVLPIICVILAIIIFILTTMIVYNTDESINKIEDSNLWGGYSSVEVHQIFDSRTGVLYAVTETGDICLIVDEEGNPRRVD